MPKEELAAWIVYFIAPCKGLHYFNAVFGKGGQV